MFRCVTYASLPAKSLLPRQKQVDTRLGERLGVKDHLAVLNVMVQKIAVNLKAFAACEEVITHTLALFQVRWTPKHRLIDVLTVQHTTLGMLQDPHLRSQALPDSCCLVFRVPLESGGVCRFVKTRTSLLHDRTWRRAS